VSRDEAIDDSSFERVRALVAMPELEAIEKGSGPAFATQLLKDLGAYCRVHRIELHLQGGGVDHVLELSARDSVSD